jgi:magnesium transporter
MAAPQEAPLQDETASAILHAAVAVAPERRVAPRIRILYRDASGTAHLDWPAGKLAEALADPGATVWVDVYDKESGLGEVESLFRDVFRFHPLAVEDALTESNSPKLDDWGEYLYGVFHTIDFDPDTDRVVTAELDFFLGRNYLVTYHAEPMEIVDGLRTLAERDGGQRLEMGADHLLYVLLDTGVAAYLPAFEHLDETIDAAQDEVFARATPRTLQKIMGVKQSALRLHRILIPQREVLNRLARDEYPQIDRKDRVYFRDVYDHLVRLHDISETLRDLITGALDTYLSATSNRTNEVMKTLTIVTVLFLPLNFVVGFFGMNFFGDNIHLDELRFPHVQIFLGVCLSMLAAPLALWIWARRRGWF